MIIEVWCKTEVCSYAHLVVAEINGRRFARHLDRIRVPASLAAFRNKPNDTAATQPYRRRMAMEPSLAALVGAAVLRTNTVLR